MSYSMISYHKSFALRGLIIQQGLITLRNSIQRMLWSSICSHSLTKNPRSLRKNLDNMIIQEMHCIMQTQPAAILFLHSEKVTVALDAPEKPRAGNSATFSFPRFSWPLCSTLALLQTWFQTRAPPSLDVMSHNFTTLNVGVFHSSPTHL